MAIGGTGGGALFGGGSLGQATGSIVIDTSQAQAAVPSMQTVGRQINAALSGIGDGARRLGGSLRSSLASGVQSLAAVGRQANQLRGELLAIGAAGAVFTGLSLRAAGSLQESQIVLEDMVGSQERANALMSSLREQARAAGIPFGDLLQSSRLLLPTLNRNTDELEKWIPLVKRVATLNAREGVTGAAFAINEALSSGGTDLVSLTERFQISRSQLREELARNGGDFAAALDTVLNRMGILTTTADRMGGTFNASLRAATDAATQFLAVGAKPLLDILTPILQKATSIFSTLQQAAPGVATFGVGLGAVAAIGAPTLLFLGQMVQTVEKLSTVIKAIPAARLAQLASIGAKAGVIGAALAVGTVGGLAVARGIGRATGNDAAANATLADVSRILRQSIFIVASGISEITVRIRTGMIQAQAGFNNGVAAMLQTMAGFARAVANLLPGTIGDQFRATAEILELFSNNLTQAAMAAGERSQAIRDQANEQLKDMQEFLGLGGGTAESGGSGTPALFDPAAAQQEQINQQRAEANRQFNEEMAAIESNQNQARLAENRQYEAQRTALITQNNKALQREEEDYARARRRQNQQLLSDIADIAAEAANREQEWVSQLTEAIDNANARASERIAEATEDTNKRIEELQREHARNRERLEQEHQNNLLSAASRLDARAIAEENRRFAQQTQQADEALSTQIDKERERLNELVQAEQEAAAKQIAEAQEAHAKRLAEAREADAQRINDMREALAEQQRLEDEDRALTLRRNREDFQEQLNNLQQQHAERLAEINNQAAREREALTARHQEELAKLVAHTNAALDIQAQGQDASLQMTQDYWNQVSGMASGASGGSTGAPTSGGSLDLEVQIGEGGQAPTTASQMPSWLTGLNPNQGSIINTINNQATQNLTAQFNITAVDPEGTAREIERILHQVVNQ